MKSILLLLFPGRALAEEEIMRIRTVYRRVTRCAVANSLLRQIMKPGRIGCAFAALAQYQLVRVGMALDAELENAASREQLGVVRTVRRVTDRAAFNLDGRMFEYEWPLLVGMTLGTGRIGAGSQPLLFGFKSAMRVVTIAALHNTFQDLVPEGHCELRFLFRVAFEAKLRLAVFQLLENGHVHSLP